MAADIGYLRAFDEDLKRRGQQPKGHGPTDASNVAGAMGNREARATQASAGPSAGEGAASGAMAGASTGNPYVMAGMAALGAINASKNRKAAEFQNRKTGRENALSTYISAINGMA
jgi:hypothetical protein